MVVSNLLPTTNNVVPDTACCLQHWIAFQLLVALAQVHERGVCHGDIKCENALVTSWNWLYLADFASYKPTYLPVNNPVSVPVLLFPFRWPAWCLSGQALSLKHGMCVRQADFSFYFDTGGRRRCYIAPERFYEAGAGDPAQLAAQPLRPEMVRVCVPRPYCPGCALAHALTACCDEGTLCRTCSPWAASLRSFSWRTERSSTCRRCCSSPSTCLHKCIFCDKPRLLSVGAGQLRGLKMFVPRSCCPTGGRSTTRPATCRKWTPPSGSSSCT